MDETTLAYKLENDRCIHSVFFRSCTL